MERDPVFPCSSSNFPASVQGTVILEKRGVNIVLLPGHVGLGEGVEKLEQRNGRGSGRGRGGRGTARSTGLHTFYTFVFVLSSRKNCTTNEG